MCRRCCVPRGVGAGTLSRSVRELCACRAARAVVPAPKRLCLSYAHVLAPVPRVPATLAADSPEILMIDSGTKVSDSKMPNAAPGRESATPSLFEGEVSHPNP